MIVNFEMFFKKTMCVTFILICEIYYLHISNRNFDPKIFNQEEKYV